MTKKAENSGLPTGEIDIGYWSKQIAVGTVTGVISYLIVKKVVK